jgi:hypothetical protein
MSCVLSEDSLQGAVPFITAIRVEFGPQESLKAIVLWRQKYGV